MKISFRLRCNLTRGGPPFTFCPAKEHRHHASTTRILVTATTVWWLIANLCVAQESSAQKRDTTLLPPKNLKTKLAPGYTIPTIDISAERSWQIIVDREAGQYLGHPTTVLLEGGQTMLIVYPKGHGCRVELQTHRIEVDHRHVLLCADLPHCLGVVGQRRGLLTVFIEAPPLHRSHQHRDASPAASRLDEPLEVQLVSCERAGVRPLVRARPESCRQEPQRSTPLRRTRPRPTNGESLRSVECHSWRRFPQL